MWPRRKRLDGRLKPFLIRAAINPAVANRLFEPFVTNHEATEGALGLLVTRLDCGKSWRRIGVVQIPNRGAHVHRQPFQSLKKGGQSIDKLRLLIRIRRLAATPQFMFISRSFRRVWEGSEGFQPCLTQSGRVSRRPILLINLARCAFNRPFGVSDCGGDLLVQQPWLSWRRLRVFAGSNEALEFFNFDPP